MWPGFKDLTTLTQNAEFFAVMSHDSGRATKQFLVYSVERHERAALRRETRILTSVV
jgi:hypothetical protein